MAQKVTPSKDKSERTIKAGKFIERITKKAKKLRAGIKPPPRKK